MRVLDLFSGIGGFSLGLERAGMETVAFCEYDKTCRQVLKKHWPDVPQYSDVRTLTKEQLDKDGITDIGLICGGFPCQDISVGHTWEKAQGLKGKRSGLWSEIVRLTQEVGPEFVIAENVRALSSRGLTQCLQDLWTVGYDTEWHVISAASIGACHLRERIWIVAYPEGKRVEGLWPKELQITQPLDAKILPIRNSNGQWEVEPDIRRSFDGISGRVDRLKQLGNAVVPQIPEMIGRAINDC